MDEFEALYGVSAAVAATPPSKKRAAAPNPGTSSKAQKQDTPLSQQAAVGSKYERRSTGTVEVQFFDGVKDQASEGEAEAFEVKLLEHFQRAGSTRYMRDTLEGKADQLETKFQTLQEAMTAAHSLTEITAVGIPGQEESTVVGRVCCEAEGKLNYLSLVLEGGIEESNSARVKLDVQDVREYSLFPGQIVAAKGINTTGAKVQASQLSQGIAPPTAEAAQATPKQTPVVWAACGPFTASADLEFEALGDLLDQCCESQPDALVLMGPFLGASHPVLRQPPKDMTYSQYFKEKIGKMIDDYMEEGTLKTKIILIPSTQDLHHNHFTFPQPAFSVQDLGLETPQAQSQVMCFPNPAMFSIGGVTYGTSSCDIIKDLSIEEISSKPLQPGAAPSRIVRITNHLLLQQSFYPLFPARAGSCIDYQSADRFDMPSKPDVLILSSDLQRFVEKIEGDVVCCNPGRLVRGGVSGTYLRCKSGKQGSEVDIVRL